MINRQFQGFCLILISLSICSLVFADSLREYHQRKCSAGNTDSCKRAAETLVGERHAERIVLGDQFAARVDRSAVEKENEPLLSNAYIHVLEDYFKAEAANGIKQTVAVDMVKLCAEQFNYYWINRKLWWPTDDEGKPDWATIYYYIVDHYYGYCLRSAL